MRRLLPAVAVVALAGAGCRDRPAGPPPERFLPEGVRVAVVIPEAGRAARQLAALHATLAAFPGAADVAAARGALTAQLGLDPLDPDGLRDAGLDARRGAAVALLTRPEAPGSPRGVGLLVLPVRDEARLEALLARLARERLGAELRALEPRGAVTPVAFRRAAGEAPALAYLVVQRTALVAHGSVGAGRGGRGGRARRGAVARAERALRRRAAGALRRAGGARLHPARLAAARADSRRSATGSRSGSPPATGCCGRARPSCSAIARPRSARSPGKGAARAAGRAAGPGRGAGGALGRRSGRARCASSSPTSPPPSGRASPRAASSRSATSPASSRPGAAAAVSLSPALELAGLDEEALRADPLRPIRFEAVAPLARSGAGPRATSRPARAAAPRRGRAPRGGGWRLATPSGEIAWRIDGDRLLLAGGPPGALDALAARLAGGGEGWRAPAGAAGAALSGGLGGAVLDAQRLVGSVRALPQDAFGTGPSGFVVRSVVDRFLEPAARLAALSLRVELAGETLVLGLEVEAVAAEARR